MKLVPLEDRIVAIVRVSPGVAIGSTCNVLSVALAPRLDENANDRPSGLHTGPESYSPAVTARGAGTPQGSIVRGSAHFRSLPPSATRTCRPLIPPPRRA